MIKSRYRLINEQELAELLKAYGQTIKNDRQIGEQIQKYPEGTMPNNYLIQKYA